MMKMRKAGEARAGRERPALFFMECGKCKDTGVLRGEFFGEAAGKFCECKEGQKRWEAILEILRRFGEIK
jgi:hypothetical protein